jgi:hypothetical protein
MTTFSDMLFQLGGVPVGGPMTQGKAIFVKPYSGSDSADGLSPSAAVKTLTKALALATANQNDVVYMFAEGNTAALTTDYLSTALDWNKDFVHLIGVNAGPWLGQRSRVAFVSTYDTAAPLFTVSANHCFIANIEFYEGVAGTAPLGCVKVTGMRNRFFNCQISGVGHASNDLTAAYSLYVSGNENHFQHCYIGLDTIVRATCTAEIRLVGTAAAKVTRTIFEDCIINSWSSLTTFKALATTYIDRFVILKNCMIIAAIGIGGAVITGAIANTTPNGAVLLQNTGVFGYVNVTTADDTTTYSMAPLPGVDSGLGSTIDIAP